MAGDGGDEGREMTSASSSEGVSNSSASGAAAFFWPFLEGVLEAAVDGAAGFLLFSADVEVRLGEAPLLDGAAWSGNCSKCLVNLE